MTPPSSREALPERAIRDQLQQILSSGDFARSERLSKFLRFIVEETIAGRSDRLKAYTIALSVFERPTSFDPQADPLVRIEATRLRRALEHYYLTEGRTDHLVICVPKGGYIPVFEPRADGQDDPLPAAEPALRTPALTAPPAMWWKRRGLVAGAVACTLLVIAGVGATHQWLRAPQPKDSTDAPVLAVLPFRSAGSDEPGQRVVEGLEEAVIDELAKLGDIRVLGRESSQLAHQLQTTGAMSKPFGVRYFVEGSLTTQDSRAIVGVRLVAYDQRQVVWSARVPITISADVATAQSETAAAVARMLAQPYGTIFRIDAARSAQSGTAAARDASCFASYYQYRMAISASAHRSVRACLDDTVKRTPNNATAWAMLALVRLDEIRFALNATEPVPVVLKAAGAVADQAVRLEPDNIRALQAAMVARFFAGDVMGGRAAGDRALAINPHDTEVLSEYGARLAQAGEWSRGARMLERALEQDPPNAGTLSGHAAFATLMEGRTDKAVAHLGRMRVEPHPSVLFVRMLVNAEAGDMKSARTAFDSLRQTAPAFIADLDRQTGIRNIPPADLQRIKSIVQRVTSAAVAVYVE